MRAHWPLALAWAGSLVAGLCPKAHAETELYGLGSATLTYTDNLFNASSNPAPGAPERRRAWYLTLSPGVGLAHDTLRARYRLEYNHAFIYYLTTVDAQAHGDAALAEASFDLTPVDTLSVGVNGSRTSTAFNLSDSGSASLAQPDTRAEFLTGNVQETLVHQYSPKWSGRETATLNANKPINSEGPEPLRFTATFGPGVEYQLERDSFSLVWNTMYYHSRSAGRGSLHVARVRYLQSGPTLTWHHDLSPEWSSELHAGVGLGLWIDDESQRDAVPSWGGALQWFRDAYNATFTYTSQMTPNLFTNQIYFSHTVAASGRWELLPEQHIALFSSHDLSAHRTLSSPGEAKTPTFNTWGSGAGVGWFPESPPMAVSLAYQHTKQFGSHGEGALPNYDRNQLVLLIQGRFPEIALSRRARRAESFRVDQADRDPDMTASKRDATDGAASKQSGGSAESNDDSQSHAD